MALLPISVVRHSSKSLAVFQDFIWHSTCPFVKGSPLILIRFHLLVGLPHIAHVRGMIEHIIFPVFVFCEHSGEANVLPGQLLRLFLAYSTSVKPLSLSAANAVTPRLRHMVSAMSNPHSLMIFCFMMFSLFLAGD